LEPNIFSQSIFAGQEDTAGLLFPPWSPHSACSNANYLLLINNIISHYVVKQRNANDQSHFSMSYESADSLQKLWPRQLKNFPIRFCQPIKFADNVTQCYYLSVTALIEEIITATIT